MIRTVDVTTPYLSTPPASFTNGARAPDLFLRLHLVEFQKSGLFPRTTAAKIRASLGTVPWESGHSVISDVSPPSAEIFWSAHLDFTANRKGIDLGTNPVAHAIQQEFSKGITNHILAQHKAIGTLPPLPAYFYGPYRATKSPAALEKLKPKLQFSFHGLATHNQTYWTLDLPGNPDHRLEQFLDDLVREGWRVEPAQPREVRPFYARGTKTNLVVEIFPQQRFPMGLDDKGNSNQFVIQYTEPFSRPTFQAALGKLLEETSNPEILLLFEPNYPRDLRARYRSALTNSPTPSPHGWLAIGRSLLDSKDTNAARDAILKGRASLAAVESPSTFDGKFSELAKRAGLKTPPEPDLTTYTNIGFVKIPAATTYEVDLPLGQPLLVCALDQAQKPVTLALLVSPSPYPGSYEVKSIKTGPGYRSVSSNGVGLGGRYGHEEELAAFPTTQKITAQIPAGSTNKVHFTIR